MNFKEYYRERLSNLLSEEKAKKQSLEKQSDSALGDLEGLLSDAHTKMRGSKDPRFAAQHKNLANHFMDAYNHHMVGEYDKAIEVARRGVASHAIKHKQIHEAARRPKVEPIGGNTAPYGYHVKKSPSGRKRYIPKTKEEAEKESEAFHKKNPNHWENVERFQRENPLNPDTDHLHTGPDDHLPGGGAAALERSRAAFGRKPR